MTIFSTFRYLNDLVDVPLPGDGNISRFIGSLITTIINVVVLVLATWKWLLPIIEKKGWTSPGHALKSIGLPTVVVLVLMVNMWYRITYLGILGGAQAFGFVDDTFASSTSDIGWVGVENDPNAGVEGGH